MSWLGEPKSLSERFREEKNTLFLPGKELHFLASKSLKLSSNLF
jgi:hypothetical protein